MLTDFGEPFLDTLVLKLLRSKRSFSCVSIEFAAFIIFVFLQDYSILNMVKFQLKGTVRSQIMLVCNGNDGPEFKGNFLTER